MYIDQSKFIEFESESGRFSVVVRLLLACTLWHANYADAAQPSYKFEGFGTVGISRSSEKSGDYTLDSTVPKGSGLSQGWAFGNDTRLGVQATSNLSSKVSTVLQVISEYNANGNYRPVVEWANVKYQLTPNSYLRLGRIALPTFLNSDHRKVGYSYPWIHPPLELYRQLAITNSDGIDTMYRFDMLDSLHTFKVLYGSNTIDRHTSVSNSENIWGVFDTIELNMLTIHASYQERKSNTRVSSSGATGDWIPNSDLSIGANYDTGGWFISTEWMQRKSTSKIGAMYFSAGTRWNALTPYMTYSQNSSGSFLPEFPPPSSLAIRLANRSQNTYTLGMRWDFMRNSDVKVQYDQVTLSNDSNGFLSNVPGNVSLQGSRFHVVSVATDFLF
ncbi:MAG: hypothetical protein WA632_07185 [Gallionella sp.]